MGYKQIGTCHPNPTDFKEVQGHSIGKAAH